MTRLVRAQREVSCTPCEPDAVLDAAARSAHARLGAHASVAGLVDGDQVVIRAAAGGSRCPVDTRVPLRDTLAGTAIRTGHSQLCTDARSDLRTDPELSAHFGILSSVTVPLVFDGGPVGMLAVRAAGPRTFDDEDRDLLALVGDAASAKLGTALSWLAPTTHQARVVAQHRLERALLEPSHPEERAALDAVLGRLSDGSAGTIAPAHRTGRLVAATRPDDPQHGVLAPGEFIGVAGERVHIVAAIVSLGHAHELTVVAEGVEAREQITLLATMGCDQAQGFLIATPLAPDALARAVRRGLRW